GIRDFHVTGVQTCALPIYVRVLKKCPACPSEVLMKKIGIITNEDKDRDFTYTRLLAESIKRQGGSPLMTDVLSEASSAGVPCGSEQDLIDSCDYLVCLGGDGTFLKAARKVYRSRIPIMGINLGNLGYLA